MNEITKKLVIKTARQHKALAKRNDSDFSYAVNVYHWEEMIDRFGADLKFRSLHLLSLFRPDFFDEDGYIYEFADMVFDLDRVLSWIAVRVLERKIERTPELQLHFDWNDLPVRIADPQMKLF